LNAQVLAASQQAAAASALSYGRQSEAAPTPPSFWDDPDTWVKTLNERLENLPSAMEQLIAQRLQQQQAQQTAVQQFYGVHPELVGKEELVEGIAVGMQRRGEAVTPESLSARATEALSKFSAASKPLKSEAEPVRGGGRATLATGAPVEYDPKDSLDDYLKTLNANRA